ncbi:NUDIX domain-containing protein [Oceanispirochaeta sp.]|jgi:NAD+ diphosphatase|uniref:NUDIX hydrolase n=1 Tax=Oceanispirochaeta sp. TaxID=2035350 RepID=UPI00262C1411|nr:NUDIX domain-containing protein [Oceanispirochaeta sp.]MDA3956009.1 NUDIX domain-containing protein [Oceanispirochaeta sp.]
MFSYCPQCQSPHPEFTDNKRTHCLSCGFVLYHNTAAAVAVLVKSGNRSIILRRGREPGKGLLDLPGGFVDPGESAEECCRREIWEELGISVTKLRYISSGYNIYPYKGVTYNTCDLFFIAECCDMNFVRQEDEVDEILLLGKDEIQLGQFAFESITKFLKEHWMEIPED